MNVLKNTSLQSHHTRNLFDLFLDVFFWLFVFVIIALRYQVFQKFNLVYIDSDQAHMWLGASDYSKGFFHEPRYYGQAYSTFMEALFAVPFLWMGLEVYSAVPLATHIIFLFPIFFTAFYLYFKGRKWNALLVLLIIICLPNSYDLLTSLPRGFITGLFFTSFYIINILNPTNLRFIFLNTALSVTAFFVNPNSMLVSAPFLFYLFLINYKTIKYYLSTCLGLAVYLPMYLIFDWFYVIHPDYVTHNLTYNLSLAYFTDAFFNLDQRFAQLSFFIDHNCVFLLLPLLVFGILFFKWDIKLFYAYLVFLLILFVTFFSGKTRDGSSWIFFSISRMYLGIPILLYLFVGTKQIVLKVQFVFIFLLPLVFVFYKNKQFNHSLINNVKVNHWEAVNVMRLDHIFNAILFYKDHCKKQNANYLAISGGFWLNSFLTYGSPAIFSDFPITENLLCDRRYWIREGNNSKIFKRFILLARKTNLEKQILKNEGFELQNIDGWGMYLVYNNRLTNKSFKQKINQLEFGN